MRKGQGAWVSYRMRYALATIFCALLCGCSTLTVEAPRYQVLGIPVTYKPNAGLAGNFGAQWTKDGPVIWYHPERVHNLDPEIVHWKILHELAHLYAPGGLRNGGVSEIEADCIALSMLHRRGLYNERLLSKIVLDMVEDEGSMTELHLNGPARAGYLLGCLVVEDLTDFELVRKALSRDRDPSGRIRWRH